MPVTWEEYLTVPDAAAKFGECRRRCQASFLEQRQRIQRLIEATKSKTIACLGAGGLNDIPYATLIRSGRPLNEGRRIAESTMTAIMGRMSAYTGRELSWDWVMNASELNLTPPHFSMTELPVTPVAVPGQTKLV